MKNFKLLFGLLLSLSALGQVGADLYLPSLPAIVDYFHTSTHLAQMSVALYMVGFTVSQLIYGPLSDGVGRRVPLIVGLLICLVGSLLCAFSPSITALIVGRIFQGLGAGAAVSLSRCILRDVFTPEQMAKYMSYLAFGTVSMMASAPLLGGYFQHYIHWRASFVFLLLWNFIVLIVVFFVLPETNQYKSMENLRFKKIAQNSFRLLSSKVFIGNAFVLSSCYAGYLSWLTAGPIILEDTVGVSALAFGWLAFAVAMTYCAGSLINGQLVSRFSLESIKKVGIVLMISAALTMLVVYLMGYVTVWAIVPPMMLYSFSTAFIFANAFSLAFRAFANIAGMASAVFTFIQLLGGFIGSTLISVLHDDNQLPLALVLVGVATIAALSNWLSSCGE